MEVDDPLPAGSSRKRQQRQADSGETLEAITKYMIAKEKAAVPESRCSTFGRHMSNELQIIKNVSIQKRVQLDIMKLVFDAQVEDGAI